MTEDGMTGDEKLKQAFAASGGGSAPAGGCPGNDLIWSAAHGELPPQRLEAILAHSLDCADCELSFRMAAGINAEIRPAGAAAADQADRPSSTVTERTGAGLLRFPPRRRLIFALGAIAAVILITITLPTLLRRGGAPLSPPPFESTVSTSLWRVGTDEDARLADGDAIRPGDRLYLTVRSDEPVHLYVINRDETGEASVLFPVEGAQYDNPLQPAAARRIPGDTAWDYDSWEVSSAGGRDSFIVVAARQPIPRLQAALDRITSATPLDPGEYVRGGDRGGADAPPEGADGAAALDEVLRDLGTPSSAAGPDVLIRRIVLDNPP